MKKLLTITILTITILTLSTYKVSAATTTAWSTSQVKLMTCYDGECTWSSNHDTNYTFSGNETSHPIKAIEWRVKASSGLSIENTYTFSFGYKLNPASVLRTEYYMKKGGDATKETITCSESTDSSGYTMFKCTFQPNEDYTSSEYLYIRIVFHEGYTNSVATKITKYEERLGTNAVITQQTNEIINIINNTTNEILDATHDYTTDNTGINDAIEEQNEIREEFEEYLDGGWEDIQQITINSEPSNFIWQIVTNLKEINQKISVFFMTILSLGVLKMILNR